ncbi:hypothetical protein TNCV_1413001 [Trichonephila clavipes]|nr:hypothetical protein TNCV_1413001 [Trichonephila clavipes]
MGIPYHAGIKGTVDGIVTHILSRQIQSETNTAKAQDHGTSVVGPSRCFAGGLYATRNNGQLWCLLRNSKKAPKSIANPTARHAVKSLGGKRFSDNEVETTMNSWLSDQAADYFEEDFHNLVLSSSSSSRSSGRTEGGVSSVNQAPPPHGTFVQWKGFLPSYLNLLDNEGGPILHSLNEAIIQ